MTADSLQAVLQSSLPLLLLLVGVATKYFRGLKNIPNAVIPYLNVVVAFLAQLFAPAAVHAAIPGAVAVAGLGVSDLLFQSVFHSIIARQLYEGFGRSLLEGLLGLKKA